jgi:hypothetical protein
LGKALGFAMHRGRTSLNKPSTHRIAWMTACIALPMVAIAQPAAPEVPTPAVAGLAPMRPLRAVVDDLGSGDFAIRSAASLELGTRADATLAALEELLRAQDLGVEQRAMVSMLAREKFAREPRAALGVRYASVWNGGRRDTPAVIEDTLEGFDSRRVLKSNDALVSFDGNPVTGRQDMRAHILSYSPGETARLEVDRNDKVIEIEVKMGDQVQLNAPNLDPLNQQQLIAQGRAAPGITSSEFDAAWSIRVKRLGLNVGEEVGVVDAKISEARWRETWLSEDGSIDPRASSQRAQLSPSGPRGAGPAAMREFADGQTVQGGRWGRGRDQTLQDRQLAQLENEAEDLRARIETLRGRLRENVDIANLNQQQQLQRNIDVQRLKEFEVQHAQHLQIIDMVRSRANQLRR